MTLKKITKIKGTLAISCRKNNDFPENPDWLNVKIARMEAANYYFGTDIYLYGWNGDFYYWISIPISSCMMCEFYTYKGDKPIWTDDNFKDFRKNAVKRKVVWRRDNFVVTSLF